MSPDNFAIRVLVVVVLTAFMPFTAVSFFRFRVHRRLQEVRRVLEILELEGAAGTPSEQRARMPSESFHGRSFILPVIFVTVLSAVGFTHLMFGEEILGQNLNLNLLLAGTAPLETLAAGPAAERLSLLVLVLAFTSAFLWSSRNVFRRLVTGDLHPGVYYSAGLRLCFAPLLALMVAWLPGTDLADGALLPAMAFLAGLFPQRALHYLKSKVALFAARANQADELPLDRIEGANAFDRLRLAEAGIDNSQNLAEADLVELLARTPYGPAQLIDWIAQAKLYVLFKDRVEALRAVSIRNAIQFEQEARSSEARAALAAQSGVPVTTIEHAYNSCAADPALVRLRRSQALLAEASRQGS